METSATKKAYDQESAEAVVPGPLSIPTLWVDSSAYGVDTMTSSDPDIVSVSGGTLETKAAGTATVTITYSNGTQRIYHITVAEGSTLILPGGLQTIEADAFNGDTSARFVKLGQNVTTVENDAFANIGDIVISAVYSGTLFADDAFTNSNPVLIVNNGGSATSYCQQHDIPYFLDFTLQ